MATLTEGKYPGEFIASVANGTRSMEKVTLLSGEKVVAGEVLGRVTVGAATVAAFAGNAANTGTIATVTVGAGAKAGAYKVVVIEPGLDAGKFTVEDPEGITVGVGTVAVAFSGGGLGFTVTDGATDFISGEGFNITVAAGSGKYAAYDQDGTDGRQIAAGIAYAGVDATSADAELVIVARDAEVAAGRLTWPADIETAEQATAEAQLKDLGIIVRD